MIWRRFRIDPARLELLEARLRRSVPHYPGPIPPESRLRLYEPNDDAAVLIKVITRSSGHPWRWRTVMGGVVAALAAGLTLSFGLFQDGGAVSAATVLQRAATQVTSRTSSPGEQGDVLYLKFVVARRVTERSGRHEWTVTLPAVVEEWRRPDGSERSRLAPAAPEFRTPSDRRAWLASGSPRLPAVPAHDFVIRPSYLRLAGLGGQGPPPDVQALQDTLAAEERQGGAAWLIAPDSVRRLPTRPGALKRVVAQNMSDPGSAATFWLLGSLLRDGTSPGQEAAIYRVLATTPGIVESSRRTDVTRARGNALSLRSGSTIDTMIVDPSTGLLDELSSRRNLDEVAWSPRSGPQALRMAVDATYTVFEASTYVTGLPQASSTKR